MNQYTEDGLSTYVANDYYYFFRKESQQKYF